MIAHPVKAAFPMGELKLAEDALKADKSSQTWAKAEAEHNLRTLRKLALVEQGWTDLHWATSRASTKGTKGWKVTQRLFALVESAMRKYEEFLVAVDTQYPDLVSLRWNEIEVEAMLPGSCLACNSESATWPADAPEFCGTACAATWACSHLSPPEPTDEEKKKYRSEGALAACVQMHKLLSAYACVPKIDAYDGSTEAAEEDLSDRVSVYLDDILRATENGLLEADVRAADEIVQACSDMERIPTIRSIGDAAMFLQKNARKIGALL